MFASIDNHSDCDCDEEQIEQELAQYKSPFELLLEEYEYLNGPISEHNPQTVMYLLMHYFKTFTKGKYVKNILHLTCLKYSMHKIVLIVMFKIFK